MQTLQVTNAESSFFETQLTALDHVDVACAVSAPPTGTDGDRQPADYVRWFPEIHRGLPGDVDVVHANYGLTGPVAASASVRLSALSERDVPLVLTLWGSDVMGDSRVVDTVSRFVADYADAVVAPSEALAATLEGDVTVVPFGVDTDLFRPMDRQAARDRLGWPDDERVALFPYDTSRDVKDFPRAKRVVEAVEADVTLRTISDVPYEDVPVYMNASDLVLVTSRREAGPMVVKEAAACNVPVVSTDVGFARTVLADVEPSIAGRTTDELADAVDRIVTTVDPRSDGREADAIISVPEMGAQLRAVYERVLD